MIDDVKEEIVDFVKTYLEDDDAIQEEYFKLAEKKNNRMAKSYEELYSFAFEWSYYDSFKEHIDDSYRRYLG